VEQELFDPKKFELHIHLETDNCIRYVKESNGLWFEVYKSKETGFFRVSIEDKSTGWFFYLLNWVDENTLLKKLSSEFAFNPINTIE